MMALAYVTGMNGEKISYHIEKRLKENLDEKVIPALHKKDKDFVIALDGKEGAGKSTLAFQLAKYVDPDFNLSRIVFSPDGFREAIYAAKKGQAIVFDEAFTGFSSRASLSGINRVLVSLMMQMRQKNLFIIIVLPTYFLLDKYVALFRTRILIHVHESRGKRGYYRIYNERLKLKLYLTGQKTYSYNHKYVRTTFRGRFYGKFALGDDAEELYRKKKALALEQSEKNPMTSQQVKFKEQRDLLLHVLKKQSKMSSREMANYLEEYDFAMSHVQINTICAKFGDASDKESESEQNQPENEKSDTKKGKTQGNER